MAVWGSVAAAVGTVVIGGMNADRASGDNRASIAGQLDAVETPTRTTGIEQLLRELNSTVNEQGLSTESQAVLDQLMQDEAFSEQVTSGTASSQAALEGALAGGDGQAQVDAMINKVLREGKAGISNVGTRTGSFGSTTEQLLNNDLIAKAAEAGVGQQNVIDARTLQAIQLAQTGNTSTVGDKTTASVRDTASETEQATEKVTDTTSVDSQQSISDQLIEPSDDVRVTGALAELIGRGIDGTGIEGVTPAAGSTATDLNATSGSLSNLAGLDLSGGAAGTDVGGIALSGGGTLADLTAELATGTTTTPPPATTPADPNNPLGDATEITQIVNDALATNIANDPANTETAANGAAATGVNNAVYVPGAAVGTQNIDVGNTPVYSPGIGGLFQQGGAASGVDLGSLLGFGGGSIGGLGNLDLSGIGAGANAGIGVVGPEVTPPPATGIDLTPPPQVLPVGNVQAGPITDAPAPTVPTPTGGSITPLGQPSGTKPTGIAPPPSIGQTGGSKAPKPIVTTPPIIDTTNLAGINQDLDNLIIGG